MALKKKVKMMDATIALKKLKRQQETVQYWKDVTNNFCNALQLLRNLIADELYDELSDTYKSDVSMLRQEERVLEHMEWMMGLSDVESSSTSEPEEDQ